VGDYGFGGKYMIGYIVFLMLIFSFMLLAVLVAKFGPLCIRFKKSSYESISGNDFLHIMRDKGSYGEFLIFEILESVEIHHRVLANLYVPKADGSMTEIDLVMICEYGLFVFESKNYSGWIFRKEREKEWTQTFGKGKKYKFFNPIWQNKAHINALKNTLKVENDDLLKSYIVFSERCKLKKIDIDTPGIVILKRSVLKRRIQKDFDQMSSQYNLGQIERLYSKLCQYVRADDSMKKNHINSVRKKQNIV
jgi:hypothetical protein